MNYNKPEITELGPASMLVQGTKSINSDQPGQLARPKDCEFEDSRLQPAAEDCLTVCFTALSWARCAGELGGAFFLTIDIPRSVRSHRPSFVSSLRKVSHRAYWSALSGSKSLCSFSQKSNHSTADC